jgi:resuscitation-promoting factor RpfB
VTGSTGQFTDSVPFTEKITEDPTLAQGTRVVEDSGVDGRRIVVKRIVKKGTTIIREDTFTSVYRPKTQIVRIGTKVEESVVSTDTVVP